MSSGCTINENEIHIRKMEPFQSGVWGRGEGGGIILIPEVGDYAPPSRKGGCHLHLF